MVKKLDDCIRSRSAAIMGQMSVREETENAGKLITSSKADALDLKELEAGLPPFAVLLLRTAGPDNPDVGKELHKLAVLYHKQEKYPEAEALYGRSLAISRKTLGESHQEIATILNNLARLYQGQKRYADAEPLYLQSVAILEQIFGPDHPKVATRLKNLASLYRAAGEEAKAVPFQKRALEILEKPHNK
ncbi:MAG: tetratricopeptide repeat protein [Acidobacteria bacterium]|nr:tetratricopeptide repeat protein [Acidobacteriota bacterium]